MSEILSEAWITVDDDGNSETVHGAGEKISAETAIELAWNFCGFYATRAEPLQDMGEHNWTCT